MFAYLLTLPLLVNPAIGQVPHFDSSKVAFNPLAYENSVKFHESELTYKGVKYVDLGKNATLEAKPFGPAPSYLVNPIFSVEGLN
jgi:hypothetical protein